MSEERAPSKRARLAMWSNFEHEIEARPYCPLDGTTLTGVVHWRAMQRQCCIKLLPGKVVQLMQTIINGLKFVVNACIWTIVLCGCSPFCWLFQ